MKPRTAALFASLAMALVLSGCGQSGRPPVVSTPSAPSGRPNTIRVNGAPNEIPANTRLEVRTNEAISSKSPDGRTYSAQIATDVVGSDGGMLLPKGSPVELVLMETRQGKGIRGSSVQLGMRSVTVQGSTYLVLSEEVSRTSGIGANRRTAQMVGGGAALGTLIGAAAGGGKGAVLGGLAGAAAGALAQILTQSKELRIPAETVLTFQLDEPVRLQPISPAVTPGGGAGAAAAATRGA
ncbi:MAG: hypothetical protein H7039_12190 [Bryobacteraceae bacterium]|nr:hypothetical protein [Bryobacteraceae bacterium]